MEPSPARTQHTIHPVTGERVEIKVRSIKSEVLLGRGGSVKGAVPGRGTHEKVIKRTNQAGTDLTISDDSDASPAEPADEIVLSDDDLATVEFDEDDQETESPEED